MPPRGAVVARQERIVHLFVAAENDARVLDRAVGVEQFAADRADGGVGFQRGNERIEPARARFGVVVEE
jgi:hypothetical protein